MLEARDSIPSMRAGRHRHFVLAAAALALSVTVCPDVCADAKSTPATGGKVSFFADQLKNNDDFRVRTKAALSLGTSDDPSAVKPLCSCLDDGSEVESVRVACAAALGKLKKPGADVCLKSHASDSSSKVKEQVASSLKSLGGAIPSTTSTDDQCPASTAPTAKAKAKYYVGVVVNNKTTRPDAEIKSMISKEVRCKLLAQGRFKLASDDQTDPKSMGVVVKKEKLDGYYLQMQVDPITYKGGQLQISMKLTIMTESRDLKGEATKTLAMPGMSSPSKDDEDDLLKMAAQKLADAFADLKP
jgi:hypothetical protein